eukprot:2293566-Amphidinium_carterae.1
MHTPPVPVLPSRSASKSHFQIMLGHRCRPSRRKSVRSTPAKEDGLAVEVQTVGSLAHGELIHEIRSPVNQVAACFPCLPCSLCLCRREEFVGINPNGATKGSGVTPKVLKQVLRLLLGG